MDHTGMIPNLLGMIQLIFSSMHARPRANPKIVGYSTPIWPKNALFTLLRPFLHPIGHKNLNGPYWKNSQPSWHVLVDFWATTPPKFGPIPETMGYSTPIWPKNATFVLFRPFVHPNGHKNLNRLL